MKKTQEQWNREILRGHKGDEERLLQSIAFHNEMIRRDEKELSEVRKTIAAFGAFEFGFLTED